MKNEISQATIGRLPLYFRTLNFAEKDGMDIISSDEFGRRLDITPEQIRKDLASFGQFGKKGVGYYVSELKNRIGNILGLENHWNFAIVGVGHLGSALANYKNFITLGFNLVALFDTDKSVVGTTINGIKVQGIDVLKEVVAERKIQIAIITVPVSEAQNVTDLLIESEVRGIWNFSPIKLSVPKPMYIVNEDLSIGLSSLSYHLARLD
ncbi:MAG: redox-sensing transcriptional repressor Rex [Selenomonadaceae bacterium]|nr:redox-sensing transcriptional repressor Rex [Selenomonadaceae bacterium]MBR1580118.1 redox-sensing transcriptional repressor Rex [Selenomonadaceae bacterium]